MTKEQILKKAIKKVYKGTKVFLPFKISWEDYINSDMYFQLIFDHKFAKAFWHCDHELEAYISGSYIERCSKCSAVKLIGDEFADWKSHLKVMVAEEEPLLYLSRFLNEEK